MIKTYLQASILCFLTCFNFIIGQVQTVDYKKTVDVDIFKSELNRQFKDYKIVEIDTKEILETVKKFNKAQNLHLKIDVNESWPMYIYPEQLLVSKMQITTATSGNLNTPLHVFPYSGNILNKESSTVRITFSEDMIYGYFSQKNGNNRFIEPLRYIIPGVSKSLYIVYNGQDVIFPEGTHCASHSLQKNKSIAKNNALPNSVGNCYELEISTASDFSMYTKYSSSVAALTAHNVGVMNNVQGNYDDEFADEIFFIIVEQWISDCSTCDPWSNSTDAGTLLSSFRTWGNGSVLLPHDVAQLWTNRDFDGSTIGIAYVGAICNSFRYQALQDFSSNANLKRVMVAHELGHNFDADHDASGAPFIMAPSVSNVAAWSPASINSIQNWYNGVSCMSLCPPPIPPAADFSANLTDICPGSTIQFFDESTASPTSWSWTFPGGTPGTSNLQNPLVTYNNIGLYNVSLTATNGIGSNSITKNGYINVSNSGSEVILIDDFSSGLTNWTVTNPDNSVTWETTSVPGSLGSQQVAWINNFDYSDGSGDFDGLNSGILDFSGRTNINLDLQYAYARYNAANSDIFRIKISTNGGATFPTTLFTGQENGTGNFATTPDQTSAFVPSDSEDWCDGITGPSCISLNLDSYIGETSIVIRFENQSDFGNNLYLDNILLYSSCQIIAPPAISFTSDVVSGCTPLVVQYQDLSTNGPTSWSWSFPGGTPAISTDQNPIVVYNTKGIYDATLSATNSAGTNTQTTSGYIEVLDVPISDFSFNIIDNTVFFTNNSTDGTFYTWNFGDNTNSGEVNPIHFYQEDGVYTVTLVAANVCGSNVFSSEVTISTLPVANFTQSNTSGCAPLTINFLDESSNNTDTYFWTFEGGTPSNSTLANPVIQYNSKGIYDVSLTVTNETGSNTILKENLVNVLSVPETNFTSSLTDLTVTFANQTIGGSTYLWDFGDTNTSTDINPVHTYSADGEYIVTLTASNSCGNFEIVKNVIISNAPIAGFIANSTNGCVPMTVNFSDNSSSNVDTWSWSFPGGTPSSSTLQNPVIVYNSAGVYDVSLIVTNEEGSDNLLLEDYISVNLGPTSDFSFTSNNLTYNFTNNAINGNMYLWDFGDTNTSTVLNPSHTYSSDGSYNVSLTVTNECGSNTSTKTIVVITPVTAGATSNLVSGCADLVVQFQDNSTNNSTSWNWSFPGGTPASSNAQNPLITYKNAGQYNVTLVASNAQFTDEVTLNNYISVSDVPISNFGFDLSLLQVIFDNNSVNGDTYFWDFGDNSTSTLENPLHNYAMEGIYTVMMIATNNCGNDTTILEVNVSALPTANFTSNVQAGCADLQVQFTDLSTSNTTSWEWEFEGGNPASSNMENPLVVYETAGVYDVTLIAKNEAGEDVFTLLDYIVVGETPSVNITQAINGNIVDFSANSSNADVYEWTIDGFPNKFFEQNPQIFFPADGTYSVVLKATNECGSTTKISSVTITAYPNANFSSSEKIGCAPLVVNYSDSSTDNPIAWNWLFQGGEPTTSNTETPEITYNIPGIYDVQLIVENAFGKDTVNSISYVEVSEKPTANFDFVITENVVNFTNTSIGEGNVTWDFGDDKTSEEINPLHVYSEAGTYIVTLTIDNGGNCIDVYTAEITITVISIEENEFFTFDLYPNPSSEFFILEIIIKESGLYNFEIINNLGQIVDKQVKPLYSGPNKFRFENDLTSGMYFVAVSYNNSKLFKKLIIEK